MRILDKHRFNNYMRQWKIMTHKAGQCLLRPAWNYLPEVASYKPFNICAAKF